VRHSILSGLVACASAVGAAIASCGSVLAVDMPVKAAAYKAPATAPSLNWTGFYAGVNAGYGWSSDAVSFDPFGTGPGNGVAAGVAAGLFPTSLSLNRSGFLGGVQAGYNRQVNRFVYGIEADFDFAGINGSPTYTHTSGQTYTTSAEAKLNVFGMLRGRIGTTLYDRSLIYATGGLAYGHAKLSTSLAGSFGATVCGALAYCGTASSSEWLAGWTIGGGWEFAMMRNWSFKAEYLYYDIGSISEVFSSDVGRGVILTDPSNERFNGHIVRIGINYRFD
jgi:outer membrane immunogenic protein